VRRYSARFVPVFVLILLLLGPAVGDAGKKETPTPRPIGGLTFTDETEVTVVNVDVFVRDKKGNPVTDLTKDDFRIYQDGVQMPISHFALLTHDIIRHYYQIPVPGQVEPTVLPEALDELEIRPIFMVLYIDNQNIRPLDRNRVLRAVRGFVRENLHPPVHMMVVSYQRSLKIEVPFTDNVREVLAALRAQKMKTGGRTDKDSTRAEIVDIMNQALEAERERPGAGLQNSAEARRAYELMRAFAAEESNDLMFSVGALREVIASLSGLQGRKSIVYISSGLPMTPGADLFQQFAAVFQSNSVLSLLAQFDRSRVFESLAAAANAQGVSFYTIDASGLQMQTDISAESRTTTNLTSITMGRSNYQDSLRFMAEETGGQAIVNTNNIARGLDKIAHDLFTYYSIGYTVSSSGSDRVHYIKVELPNHKKYKLRYRRRYVEKSLETRVQDKVMTALVFDVQHNPLLVNVESGTPSPATSDRWTVPFHISFPLDKLAMLPEGDEYVGRVVLFVAARDSKGKQSDLQRQEHEIRIPASDWDRARKERFGIDLSLLMESGTYNVAVGLMDVVTREASYTKSVVRVNPGGRKKTAR